MKRLATLLLIPGLFLAACGDDDTSIAFEDTTEDATEATTDTTPSEEPASTDAALPSADCDAAFADAASKGDMEDTAEDLWPAARVCESLADWTAASEAHPDALNGADPEEFARNTCQFGDDMGGSALCAEVLG